MERRIAAILAADMVGYSRLLELDETRTLERQKRHRIELIDPLIGQFNGTIIKLTGDGLIAEFGSVVEAVQCAVTTQKEMAAREADIPEDRKIQYRIAVHLGDVVFDEGDVYGDGVNIAARLEAIADPGGIVVSGTAHDLLKAHVDVGYRSLGEKQLKNIAQPVRVFQVVEGIAQQARTRTRRMPLLAAALAGAIALLGGFSWWFMTPEFEPLDPAELAFEIPDKPSIAVVPFQDISAQSDNDWLSTGIAQNIELTITKSSEITVISSRAVAGMAARTPAEIAQNFGVRHVLLGNVALEEDRLRVSAQLIDAQTGRSVWADSFDRTADDLVSVQTEVSEQILEELQVKLTVGEQARTWRANLGSADNMRRFVQGRVAFQRFDPEGHSIAARLWGEIIEEDPDSPMAAFVRGWLLWQRVYIGISSNPIADLKDAETAADIAVEDATDGNPHILKAQLKLLKGDNEGALDWAEQAVAASPGLADVLLLAGSVYVSVGEHEQGLSLLERGMRLEPDYPDWVNQQLMAANTMLGRYEDAREIALAVVDSDTIVDVRLKPAALRVLTVVSVWQDRQKDAQNYARQLLELVPEFTLEDARGLFAERDREFAERYVAALSEAGVPDTGSTGNREEGRILPDKPSIAVMPFANLSGTQDHDYLGDGLASNVISTLGTIPQIFVIARQSSFALRDEPKGAPGIAEALGVRYVLDGNIQVSGDRLRTSVELVDAQRDRQIWSRQFDNDLAVEDLFTIQDQIVADVLAELDATLVSGDHSRTVFREVGDLETFKQIMLGLAEVDKITIDGDRKALEHFEAVLARNPNSAYAHFGISWVTLNAILYGVSDPAQTLQKARFHAKKAVQANSDVAVSHIALAFVHLYLREHDLAVASAERALALAPSNGRIVSQAGWIFSACGLPQRGEALLRLGLRTQPSPPVWVPNLLAITLLMQGKMDEAKGFFEQANAIFPNPSSHSHLAAIAALRNDTAEADLHVRKALEIYPAGSVAGSARYWAYIRDQAYLARYLDALRAAGYPENPR